ncbi:hypothetical protein L207DRAFT_518402 [Hyaloscypha variabilis F]|uniref:Uncharacterized protein n=1 Tax=Hyaloscypha variabilis (strain UAMH 11265 / GT02V1 / F) TaxID=1149755 RepID=A0A2J6R3J9_HYAVF|nr:hypothetical protein L207DRAFT_518402 [Hyaloscypha variabilis F]
MHISKLLDPAQTVLTPPSEPMGKLPSHQVIAIDAKVQMDIDYCFHVHENKQTCRIEIPFDSLYGSQVPSDRHGKRIRGSRPFEKLDLTIVHLGFNDSIVVSLFSAFPHYRIPTRHRFRHRVEMTLSGELRQVAFNKQQDGEYDILFYLVLRYTALVEGITPQHASSRPRSFPCLINILQTPHFHFLQTLLYSKSLIFRVPQNASLVLSPAYCPSSCTHRTGVRRYSRRGHLLEAQL